MQATPPASTLSLPTLTALLAGTPFTGHLHAFASVPSTNDLAQAAAQSGVQAGAQSGVHPGAPAGLWVADAQTRGRGRGGHHWLSAPGEGLYLSILLRPALAAADVLKLSLAAGLAVRTAVLATTGLTLDLRWPNDLMLTPLEPSSASPDRKCGGILTETALDGATGRLSYAVTGIGLNLLHRTFPDDLAGQATSLHLAGAPAVPREPLIAAIALALLDQTRQLEQDPASVLPRFEAASTWVRGLRVHVQEDGGYTGRTAGLDRNGLLQVMLADGSLRTVRHGGVRRARTA